MNKLIFLLLLCTTSAIPRAQAQSSGAAKAQQAPARVEFRIVPAHDGTFGYDIYSNKRLLIHQPTIPAIAGQKGFRSRKAAESVARLVVRKISNGEMPPSVTIDEMKRLGAL